MPRFVFKPSVWCIRSRFCFLGFPVRFCLYSETIPYASNFSLDEISLLWNEYRLFQLLIEFHKERGLSVFSSEGLPLKKLTTFPNGSQFPKESIHYGIRSRFYRHIFLKLLHSVCLLASFFPASERQRSVPKLSFRFFVNGHKIV